MGSEEIGHRVFQGRDCSSILHCPSSVMASDHSISENVAEMSMCSESLFQSPTGIDPFYSSGWDTVIPGNQTGNFLGNSSMVHQNEFASNNNPHYPVVMENQTMGLVHFASDSGLVDLMPKIPSFGSGEMVNSSFGRIEESGCRSSFHRVPTVGSQEHCQSPEEDGVFKDSLNGKRKRKVSMGASSCKTVEVEERKDHQTGNNSEFPKEDEKKNIGTNSSRSKQAVKQAKDNSGGGGAEPSKEDYILVRAKRGQATNSHSLAERVRRERISERMRLLQELVPGCNKITGKAVMLDEIINYVQSLQQQVEFLSMKLATVNPELNVDIDQILSKDLLHPRSSNATGLGIGPGLSLSHAFPAFPQGIINGFSGTAPPFHPLPPNLWNNELQSILQMGFDSSPSGLSKLEL